jgi:hypothetical protein
MSTRASSPRSATPGTGGGRDGKDHAAVLGHWNALTEALGEAHPELAQRFTDLRDSHGDDIWDIGVE